MTDHQHATSDPDLRHADPEIADLVAAEAERQRDSVRLIASENYVSAAVLEATGTVLTNKYSEGYSGKRYYEGQQVIDQVETLAIERAKALFGVEHANVQPYSGSPANLAVYLAFLAPGETVMGMALPAGGHLTHGWSVSATGKWFRAVQYGVRKETGRVDMDEVRELALAERPKVIFCGGTAIPRTIDFPAFAEIAREVGAVLVADIAHIAGLVAGGAHPSPVGHADVITTTTHKTLRGPRGAMIMSTAEHAKALDKAVFPGLQGGPHNHTTAAIAVALKEASTAGVQHLRARDRGERQGARRGPRRARLRPRVAAAPTTTCCSSTSTNKAIAGKPAAKALDRAGIELNYNSVPVRPAQAVRPVRHPHRHRGGHLPRHDHGRHGPDRRLDRRRRRRGVGRRRGGGREGRRRGPGLHPRLPHAGPARLTPPAAPPAPDTAPAGQDTGRTRDNGRHGDLAGNGVPARRDLRRGRAPTSRSSRRSPTASSCACSTARRPAGGG